MQKSYKSDSYFIGRDHAAWSYCDQFCWNVKNLRNYANYIIRQEYIKNKKYLNYYDIDKLVRSESPECYLKIPAKLAQSLFRELDQNWKKRTLSEADMVHDEEDDEEEVEEALVDGVVFLDALVSFGVGKVDAEGGGVGGAGGGGEDVDVKVVFDGVGEAGDEVHAAAGAAAGEFGMDLGVHGAGEVRDGLRGEEREEGAAAHMFSMRRRRRNLIGRFEGPVCRGGVAAVNGDHLAGDVVRRVTGQEHGRAGEVGGGAHAGIGLGALQPIVHVLGLPHVLVQVGEDEAGGDAVHLDVVAAPFGGLDAREAGEARFADGVDAQERNAE